MNQDQEKFYIQCQNCGALNRIPIAKSKTQAYCGKCAKAIQHHSGVVDVQDQFFQKLIDKSPVPVIVDFWASWCGPCQVFSPTFLQVAQKLCTKAIFVKMNTEKNQIIPSQLGIRSIPTLIVYKNGQILERISGAMDAHNFELFLNKFLR